MKTFTKDELIKDLIAIKEKGWIQTERNFNHGNIGNTLEDLLGIEENNLPIPNANEWELKTQKVGTTSLITLFHCEPSPTAIKFVPKVLLPHFGWKHQFAGQRYPDDELSFRQTISANVTSNRGFHVIVDHNYRKIRVSFDPDRVDACHSQWLDNIKRRGFAKDLEPQPYWGFDDLKFKAGTKLKNCFFVIAESKSDDCKKYIRYVSATILSNFNFDGFLDALEQGSILIDFDARTGHNHGTKFRIKQDSWSMLYEVRQTIF